MSRLPNFIIIGAAKSGTTSLCDFLSTHPDIYISNPKEPCFFDENVSWNKGIDWYRSLFTGAEQNQICGEASTNYTRWPQVDGVPEKIYQFIPNVKLIYIMRDPIKRAYSHYVHRWTKETHPGEPVTQTFAEYVRHDPMCIDSSQYAWQINRYLRFFPMNQLLLITFEDFINDTNSISNKIFSFLGVRNNIFRDMQVPLSNENKSFRDNVVKNNVISKIKSIPGMALLFSFAPKNAKQYIFNHLIAKTKYFRSLRDQFNPLPLTETDQITLRKTFEKSNEELSRRWGVNTNCWCK